MLKLKKKPKKYFILIDCLGAIDIEDVPGSNYITSEDRKLAKDENPNRSYENQVGTAYYLFDVFNHLIQHFESYNKLANGVEIILMGTNAEVATAKRYLPQSIYSTSVYSMPVGSISTASKWKFAREKEQQNNSVIIYSDKASGASYHTLRVIVGSFIKIHSFARLVEKDEKVSIPWKVTKTVLHYGSKV
jgi:hypothetical protein